MFREFIHTVYGLVVAGRFGLLRDYFDLINRILDAPTELPRIGLVATIKPKE